MIEEFSERIRQAAARGTSLRLRGGGSKDFYGGPLTGEVLDVSGHTGVVAYEPSELYLTARAGTPLREIEALLAQHGQMVPFEPPHFGPHATLGGCVAAGLAGPRRASAGALRDFVLGVVMLDGRGQRLTFGGQVMKNVAGFDVSRLMCGAMGTLGLLLEMSIKVLPRPACELTLCLEMTAAQALTRFNQWGGEPLPISATSAQDGRVWVRLSGGEAGVAAAREVIGGEAVADGAQHWAALREHTAPVFAGEAPLWRVSVPSDTPVFEDDRVVEWGGSLRWWRSDAPADTLREPVARWGGHVTRFDGQMRETALATPSPEIQKISQRLKAAFDPHGVFNRGRLGFI